MCPHFWKRLTCASKNEFNLLMNLCDMPLFISYYNF